MIVEIPVVLGIKQDCPGSLMPFVPLTVANMAGIVDRGDTAEIHALVHALRAAVDSLDALRVLARHAGRPS